MYSIQETKEYQKFLEIINKIPEEYDEFRKILLEYYRENALAKTSYRGFQNFSEPLCRNLKNINLSSIYYYLEYILQLYKEEFERVLNDISCICYAASGNIHFICGHCVYKSDIDKYLLKDNFSFEDNYDNNEIKECIKNIIEYEDDAIRQCVNQKWKNETFCDKCSSYHLCLRPEYQEYLKSQE